MRFFLIALLALAAPAHAYCVYNQLGTRDIDVAQEEPHPDRLRDERRLKALIKPGQRRCCAFHNLDCNPGGRDNSVVNLAITIPGEPAYQCGFPPGSEPNVKVTGNGTVRVQPNPRRSKSAWPYVVRVRTQDRQDLTGPRGIACPEINTKGK
ncbi:MAG: hypothetical protein ACXWAC_09480 [Usitatibacter sp.]